MSLSSAGAISVSGMTAASTRLEASASNIANMRTTGAVPGVGTTSTVYRPVATVQQAVTGGGVVASTVAQTPAWHLQADPTSPNADSQGLVAAPNVDLTGELVNVMTARIAYEASLKTFAAADDMQKALIESTS